MQNICKDVIVALILEVSNSHQIGLRDHVTESNHDWYYKTNQLHVASEVMDF